jgi:hypothetical protein
MIGTRHREWQVLGGLVKVRVISRALAVTAVTALGAAGMTAAAHAAVAPSTAKAAVRAAGAQPYDFNGDGYSDLALGSPYGTVGSYTTAGFVTIVYGSSAGPDTAKHQVISQNTAGVPGTAEVADHFGFSVTSLDYDEDGYADLLVGAPDEDTTDGANAGSETILWGSASGLSGTGSDAMGEPQGAGAAHRFGYSLVSADFDGDGHTDWVDTSPGDGFFWPFKNPGSALQARKSAQSAKVFAPTAQPHKVRGGRGKAVAAAADAAVTGFIPAAGDVNGDSKPDLIIGWQDTDDPTYGFDVWDDFSDQGPSFANEQITRVDSLAVGDFDGDGYGDVAVGGADESNGVGGHVTVYKGDADVTLGTSSTISQNSAGLPGGAVAGDRFGYSLAAGDVNKDGKSDLAVGVPYRSINSLAHAGEAIVFHGADSGLSGAGAQIFSQDTAGVPGAAEAEDAMGWTVVLQNPNADGYADVIVGAPKENGTDGAVSVLPGNASGATATGSATFGAGTLGTSGKDAQIGVRQGRIG